MLQNLLRRVLGAYWIGRIKLACFHLHNLVCYAHQQCPGSFLYLASNGDHLNLKSFRRCLAARLCEMRISQYEAEPSPGLAEFLAQAGPSQSPGVGGLPRGLGNPGPTFLIGRLGFATA